MCGEHLAGAAGDVLAQGSSPRVRGTRGGVRSGRAVRGIIPACAGNTRREGRSVRRSRDHPRVCGEHLGGCHAGAVQDGSSPRVRGTPCHGLHHACRPGIIPACAGNTFINLRLRKGTWDHPRVCGEHYADVLTMEKTQGSSPRVRGTRHPADCHPVRPGIIPACAGNTISTVGRSPRIRDHPRVCGEHKPIEDTK